MAEESFIKNLNTIAINVLKRFLNKNAYSVHDLFGYF